MWGPCCRFAFFHSNRQWQTFSKPSTTQNVAACYIILISSPSNPSLLLLLLMAILFSQTHQPITLLFLTHHLLLLLFVHSVPEIFYSLRFCFFLPNCMQFLIICLVDQKLKWTHLRARKFKLKKISENLCCICLFFFYFYFQTIIAAELFHMDKIWFCEWIFHMGRYKFEEEAWRCYAHCYGTRAGGNSGWPWGLYLLFVSFIM